MRLLFLLLLLSACASAPKDAPLRRGELKEVSQGVAPGSSKAQVRAALGAPASEVPFENGYEAWVYRQQLKENEKPPRKELVLLFDRSGILARSRVR